MYPDDLTYTRDHEWARADGDRATLGITDYAQEQLGDIVYVNVRRASLTNTIPSLLARCAGSSGE
jgi:glycine cleavage system H lipoate-binding protein